jgi:hypothetical protein
MKATEKKRKRKMKATSPQAVVTPTILTLKDRYGEPERGE